jgi:hypothetical protein
VFVLSPALAADWGSLAVGQSHSDDTIAIGKYTLKLPPGNWVTVGKTEARQGSQTGSSGSPAQLTALFARADAGQISALLAVRTPASTFVGISRWNDDPCKFVDRAVVTDTMKQTFAMPECFAVAPFGAEAFTSAREGAGAQFAQWMVSSQNKLPEKLWRVFYTKYWGGDFIHVNLYLPATGDHAAAEKWGRQAAAAVQPMVMRDASQAALPPLP